MGKQKKTNLNRKMDITVKWSGKEMKITGLGDTDTVKSLKDAIHKETGVRPERQKLLGLKYKGIQFIFPQHRSLSFCVPTITRA